MILFRVTPLASVVERVAATSDLVLEIVVAADAMSASKKNDISGVIASVLEIYATCVLKQIFTQLTVRINDIFSAPFAALQNSLPTQCSFIATTDNSHKSKNFTNKDW